MLNSQPVSYAPYQPALALKQKFGLQTNADLSKTKSQPFPASFYQPNFVMTGTINEPRTLGRTNYPSPHTLNPGNTLGNIDAKLSFVDEGWYQEKYRQRKRAALTTSSDPLDYLSGRNFPIQRGIRIRDIGTGLQTHSIAPGKTVQFSLTQFKVTPAEMENRQERARRLAGQGVPLVRI